MPNYFFLGGIPSCFHVYGAQLRFDTNLIPADKVISSKEVKNTSESTSYLKVMSESFYKVTLLLLHTVSASPAWVTDYSAMTPPKNHLASYTKDPDTREVIEVVKDRGQHSSL